MMLLCLRRVLRLLYWSGLLLIPIAVVSACDRPDSLPETATAIVVEPTTVVHTAVPQPTPLTEPTILVEPETALADEPLTIQMLGLEPGQTITLRASMQDSNSHKWESEATFVVDSIGIVDVTTQAPISGTYATADPMGLIWSMVPKALAGRRVAYVPGESSPIVITLTAESEGKTIATTYHRRLLQAEDVEMTVVSENGLVGFFFVPEATNPLPTLLILGGSGGGVDFSRAVMLASHGYATLALDYFGNEPLPLSLTEIPLEYFATAVSWLKSQEIVDDTKIGVVGTSRGGELALLLGANYPELFQVVVGYVASGLVNGNISSDGVHEKAAWTIGGEPVPFNVGSNREEATIPVEKIQAPVLLISGKSDRLWPSFAWSEIAMNRLAENDHPYPYEHLAYDNAGHWIGVPHWPTTGRDSITHPVTGGQIWFGGTPEGNAFASADSWAHLLEFLENNFAGDDS